MSFLNVIKRFFGKSDEEYARDKVRRKSAEGVSPDSPSNEVKKGIERSRNVSI